MFKKLFNILTIFVLFPFILSGNSLLDSSTFTRKYDSAWYYYESHDYSNSLNILYQLEDYIDTNSEYQVKKLSNIFNLIGMNYINFGNYSQSLDYCIKALELTKDTALIAVIYMNMGTVLLKLGEYSKVISYYNKALTLIANDDKYAIKEPIFYNIGCAHLKAKNWKESEFYTRKSISLNSAKPEKDNGISYLNLAIAFQNMQTIDSASFYFKKAIHSLKNERNSDNYIIAYAYLDYADFLREQFSYPQSQSYFEQALKIFSQSLGQKHYNISRCFMGKGQLSMDRGNFFEALNFYQKALISQIKNFNNTDIYSFPQGQLLPDLDLIEIFKRKAEAFENLAEMQNAKKNLEASLVSIDQSISIIEKLRQGYQSESSKLQLTENENNIYSAGLRVASRLFDLTNHVKYLNRAFEFSERSKYGITRELRGDFNAKSIAGIPDSLVEKERNLAVEISNLRVFIENSDQTAINSANSKLFNLTCEQEKLIAGFEKDFPAYYRLKYSNSVVNLAELQKTISSSQALIEYSILDSLIYIFLVTQDTSCLIKQTADTSFYNSLAFIQKFLRLNYSLEYPLWRKSSYVLYEHLVLPVEPLIRAKELIIVPDIRLSLISFESLTTKPYKENKWHKYEQEPYLLYDYPIGYSLSASMLFTTSKNTHKIMGRFIGFAPDYIGSPDSLPEMPEAPISLRSIARLFFGRSFTSEKATKYSFLKLKKSYKIIHFYAHGLEDTLNPQLSKMVLHQGQGKSEDSYLYAYEISNLNITTDLITLISCYSGSGTVVEGEGVLSIGRSFFNAGVPSMVISLWAATGTSFKIMKEFYWNLLKGERKTVALQKAKIKYISQANPIDTNPRLWSSLVVVGNPEPIFHGYRLKVLSIFTGILILLILLIKYGKKLF